jgi:lipopolysaccharide/colanic/teichoic acid biosynthesis glycosyltransferase
MTRAAMTSRHPSASPVRAPVPAGTTGRPSTGRLRTIGSAPSMPNRRVRRRWAAQRALDVVVAGTALMLLAPLMALVAVLIRCTSRGPVLFRQVRLGRGRTPFVMLKFRSMYAGSDDKAHREYVRRLLTGRAEPMGPGAGLYKLSGDVRITPVGRLLRRWSIDELPQLINVLRGEMALVGPRPVLPWEAALFDPRHEKRFDVPPGITGLWQTSGRNRLSMTEALELDVRYAEQTSLRLDVAILLRTLPAVLGSGVR